VADCLKEAYPKLRMIGLDIISLTSQLDRHEGMASHKRFPPQFTVVEDMDLKNFTVAPVLFENMNGVPCTVIAEIEGEYIVKYVAEIPARIGSQRVKMKNLRMLNGKPMIAWAIEACKEATRVDEVYVNTENDTLGKVAEKWGVKHYLRKPELAEDHIANDQFNYDFLKNVDCDALVMVNPVSPLVLPEDIDGAIEYFEENNFDSMVAVKPEKLHSFYKGEALNFSTDGLVPMTQNIDPVKVCVWAVCVWRKETFLRHYEAKGFATFHGKIGLYPMHSVRPIKVSEEEDFQLAELLLKAREQPETEISYYDI